jgi:hypothetical protein
MITIRGAPEVRGVDPSSIVFEFVTAFVDTKVKNPTAVSMISSLNYKQLFEYIWRSLTAIDAAGVLDNKEILCGGDQLDSFLTNASRWRETSYNDSGRLWTLRTWHSIAETVNPLCWKCYDSCTDVTSALRREGFILLRHWTIAMSMITLRAF